ncbi:hypothetical protein K461DRAFT_324308 [Myriangium duriaei CBS 260.36]|uniref:Uncharacterized protein n=1 Tax=Myriangium duriaei CBS 260.36 TaxID=1168546 RepID=A0A9P4MCK4_9PEZI|nr:hypothetical protein K461DRAFT_324308 [Myriangium duriaei CBS 260.36]
MATAAVLPPQSAFQSADFNARTKFVSDTLTGSSVEKTNLDDEDISSIPPIMSRLPRDPSSNDEDLDQELDYIVSETQGDNPRPVLYTISHLPNIDPASIAVWRTLHNLRPLTTDYAGDFGNDSPQTPNGCPFSRTARRNSRKSVDLTVCPFSKSSTATRTSLDLIRSVFNWTELSMPADVEATFYGVIFRSKRRAGSDTIDLYQADKLSHEEAVTSGGLLMYWYGIPDSRTGNNLATCIWTSREHAKVASRLPTHKMAAKLAQDAYQSFELSRYAVVKRKGETGVHIQP